MHPTKKSLYIITVTTLLLVLSACSKGGSTEDSNNNNENNQGQQATIVEDLARDEVLFRMEEAAPTLRTLHAEGSRLLIDTQGDSYTFVMDQSYQDNLVLTHSDAIINLGEIKNTRLIITPEGSFINSDDQGWNATEPKQEDTNLYYGAVYKSFREIAQYMTMIETGDSYMFGFTGKSAEVYKSISPNFSVALGSADTDQIEMNLTYRVDKATLYLAGVSQSFTQKVEDKTHTVKGDINFSQFNAPVEILTPDQMPQNVLHQKKPTRQ